MTLQDARPAIRWRELPGVKAYRVQIEARVPEGEVIEHIDARVSGTDFRPPRPLAGRRAAIKLLVSAGCADVPSIAQETAWFYVDAAKACPAPQQLSFTGTARGELSWDRVAAAAEYELQLFRLADGQLLDRRRVTAPPAVLPGHAGPMLVAVRSYCGSSSGEPAYGVVPSSP